MFHIITSGDCWLQVGDSKPQLLRQGALALVPHGRGHTISSCDSAAVVDLFDIPVTRLSERYELLNYGEGGDLTELTCGVVSFDHAAGAQLVKQLPDLIVVDSWAQESDSWLHSTLRFIASEARSPKPGGDTILTHLADILVIQALRSWIETAPEANQGWLAALKDKQIGKALTMMHQHPERDWSVDSLASAVGMSRSGFSARFTKMVGDSAKSYLTHWRMQLARARLRQDDIPLAVLAEELGYQSEAAFAKAFKRVVGIAPGSLRGAVS